MNTVAPEDLHHMERIVEGLPSKSEKIRQLATAGFEKADIARFLGIRYQFVYNVLAATELKTVAGLAAEAVGGSEEAEGRDDLIGDVRTASSDRWAWAKIEKGGRVILPQAFCNCLGIADGDDVQLRLDGDSIQILNRSAALRSLHEDARRYIPEGHSLVDELIAERRAEAKAEIDDD